MTWTVPKGARGVDVAHWQGIIDWKKVAASGIGWVSAKVTQGTSFVDSRGHANLQGAAAAGLTVTAYHFADPNDKLTAAKDATAQAVHYMESLSRYGGPAVLDWEKNLSTFDPLWQLQWIAEWEAYFKARWDRPTVLYCDRVDGRRLAQAQHKHGTAPLPQLWLADWVGKVGAKPSDAPGDLASVAAAAAKYGLDDVVWWQWADRGTIPGISGSDDVDTDIAVRLLTL